MSVWLALAFSGLALQRVQQTLDPSLWRSLPLVLVHTHAQRTQVVACSQQAAQAGVHAGMSLSAAQALLGSNLVWFPYQPEQTAATRQQLASWAYQFSSQVALFPSAEGDGLIIEIGGSHRLLGPTVQAAAHIQGALKMLGYMASEASAATPAAARLLARARMAGLSCPAHFVSQASSLLPQSPETDLRQRLSGIPVSLLPWDSSLIHKLELLGLKQLGDLFQLPRAAFARRLGPDCLNTLDQLLGMQPEPQIFLIPATGFSEQLELPSDLSDVLRLLVPLKHLLLLLSGFLRARGWGAKTLVLRAFHDHTYGVAHPPTQVVLRLALPQRNPDTLLALFRERFSRVILPRAATALQLQLQDHEIWQGYHDNLLPGPDPDNHEREQAQLLQILQARLGEQAVFSLACRDDHRPEQAWQRCEPGIRVRARRSEATSSLSPAPWQRPGIILKSPLPLPAPAAPQDLPSYRGALTYLTGPERIEAGWWDLASEALPVARDYFVARNRSGQTLWIYREHAPPHAWFLQGFFA